VTIHSANFLNTRMTANNTAAFRLARAGYQSTGVPTLLTTVSATSNLKIGKLHIKGLANPNTGLYPTYPVGRTGVRNCTGFNLFKRNTSYTDRNWLVEVQDYLWATYPGQAADRQLLEFPDINYSGSIQIRRLGERGSNVVSYDNYVLNGCFDKWLTTTATVTAGAQEVANKWTLRGITGAVTVDRVQDSFGANAQFDARITVGTAGTFQSWDQDIGFPVEWLGQPLRLTFDMKAAAAGRVLEQITATFLNNGGGSPANIFKQVWSGSDSKLDATTDFKTYVLDFAAVDPASVVTLGTAAVMRLSFQFNNTTAVRAPVVTFGNISLVRLAGIKFARAPYDRLALAASDVVGLGALATAASVNLTTQATGTLQAAQMPAHTGDVTSSVGALALTIAANVVDNSKLSQVATARLKGRISAGTGSVEDLTGTQVTAMLDAFSSTTKGLVPASGGGITTFLRADGSFAAPAPAGSTTQVLFNNAGATGAASEVLVENNQLRLPNAASFSTPAAGGTRLVGRSDAGRTVPAFLSQDGVVRDLQTSLARNSPVIWKPVPGSNSLSVIGSVAPLSLGTATAVQLAATNLHTMSPKLEYLVTVAAANAVAGFYTNTGMCAFGGTASLGGFHFIGRWGPVTGVATTTSRAFFGMVANLGITPTDVEPSTQLHCIGMGWDAADTKIQIMCNDASGTCTKIDLGASFPRPTTDRTALYELALFNPKSATGSVSWLVTNLVSGATASGNITTDLPVVGTIMVPRGYMSVGGTSSVIGFGLNSLYVDPLL
jgi:hypothetical protein